MEKIKVLFLAANPTDTPSLMLAEENRLLMAKIRSSENRASLDVVSQWAVTTDDLIQYLNVYQPQIVHFSGHGGALGEIILHDEKGFAKTISVKAIKSLFKTLKDNIRVVILNACYSQPQAESVTELIDCAIGMKTNVDDKAAITFSASFYRAIGFGRSIQEAYEQGVTALLLEGFEESNIPELTMKEGVDPAKMYLVKPLTTSTAPTPGQTSSSDLFGSEHKMVFGSDDLGKGIKLGGKYRNIFLRFLSSEWTRYGSIGWVKSGWLYCPPYFGVSHAVVFFKVHISDDGKGYIHLNSVANPKHNIWLETQAGFRQDGIFGWNGGNDQRIALWQFYWK